MKTSLFRSVIALCALIFIAQIVQAKTAADNAKASGDANSLRGIRALYISNWRGDRTFKCNLQREMRVMGFSFVANRRHAQAIVSARGGGNRGDFSGELWIRDRAGKTLWHERAYRPRGSNQMAYISLASKLRAALQR